MVKEGKKGSIADDFFVRPEAEISHQNFNSYQLTGIQKSEEKNYYMETQGRGYSDLYRNSSEELFLKSLMEGSVGMPVPTTEMLGFKNLSHNFRTDSEELFKSWLTNGENHGYSSSSIAHRTRTASRRISTELANFSTQPHGDILQKKRSNDILYSQNNPVADDVPVNHNQQSIMWNTAESGMQASNLYLAKAWFHSSQPMTRSRSSELRRKYAAMQNARTAIGMEAMHNATVQEANDSKQEFPNPNGFNDVPACELPNQVGTFMSPSNSSSNFNNLQTGNVDKVSSVVSMLKGTLERKKIGNQIDKEAVEDSSGRHFSPQDFLLNHQGQGTYIHEMSGTFQEVSLDQIKDIANITTVQGSVNVELQGFVNPTNPVQLSLVSREASQSESSAAAPVVSSGFDACDGPSNSGQTLSFCESSRKQVRNSRSPENGSKTKDFRERIIDNLKEDRKRGGLVRYGSVTSTGSADKGDPTKKRRVERSRKMAEAKERNSTPAIPSDMQSVLKRCENLEKEVRSLKLNLSFMNRKDSEQTKQIEELQQQNSELIDEKERLLEEIERILSETGKM